MKSPNVVPIGATASTDEKLDHVLLDSCGVPPHHVGARQNDFAEEVWGRGAPFVNGRSLYVFGNAGRGKTHLAVALLREKIRPIIDSIASRRVKFVSVTRMLATVREAFVKNESELEVIDMFSGLNCLVIDDLGVEKPTDWALQTLTFIIDQRYGAEKQMLVTSNLSLERLAGRLGDRIASRLAEICAVVELGGESKRVRRK